jgi:hypothetical protein
VETFRCGSKAKVNRQVNEPFDYVWRQPEARIGALGMFGIGSRAQKAEQALRQAMAQHEKLVQELNTALSERDEYLRQRDIALGERNVFLRQRDVALGEANEFRRQRDQLLSENEQLKLGKVERTRSEPPPSG